MSCNTGIVRVVMMLLLAFAVASTDGYAAKRKPRTMSSVKKEQRATQRAIKLTAEQIEANAKKTSRTLNALNTLNADIKQQSVSIDRLALQIDSIDAAVAVLSDSIAQLDARLAGMRESYARSVRKMRNANDGSMSKLAFIFSSESFTQAYRRMRYLKEFSARREKKSDEIKAMQQQLDGQRAKLADMQAGKSETMAQMSRTKADMEKKREETSVLVAELKKEGSSLKKVLREKEAQARALDSELDRLIAEEQRRQEEERRREEKRLKEEQLRKAEEAKRSMAKSDDAKKPEVKGKDRAAADKPSTSSKPSKSSAGNKTASTSKTAKTGGSNFTNTAAADRALSGSFESNKGKLLFPVTGKYRIVRPFGRHQHPDLPHVTTDNSGIDIEVPAGGNARAVFGGTVSAIFRQPGFNTIVMLRHGNYLTIYANLSDILVKKGDKLKQGQTIGRIYSDPDDDNRSILHFELRKETQKLNPSAWVR